MSKFSKIPNLADIHSGVPERLREEAGVAKENVDALGTLPVSSPRRSSLKLPPDISRDDFDKAIGALKGRLGNEAVELNDKPLVDGWCTEHPSVIFLLSSH